MALRYRKTVYKDYWTRYDCLVEAFELGVGFFDDDETFEWWVNCPGVFENYERGECKSLEEGKRLAENSLRKLCSNVLKRMKVVK